MTMYEEVICLKCHHMRSSNLTLPCDRCGAKQTLFGYLWPHEFKGYLTLVIAVGILLVLAVLAALAFLVILQLNSQHVNIGPNLVQLMISRN